MAEDKQTEKKPDVIGDLIKIKFSGPGLSCQVGEIIFIEPNTVRGNENGWFYIRYGKYIVKEMSGAEVTQVQRVAAIQDNIVEVGGANGKITSAHLKVIAVFELALEKASQERGTVPTIQVGVAPAGIGRLRGSHWSLIFEFLAPQKDKRKPGAFGFKFDLGLAALTATSKYVGKTVSMIPLWITQVLGLGHSHVAAVLEHKDLTCSYVASYIGKNLACLPDAIRNNPKFKQVLRPATLHSQEGRQAAAEFSPPVRVAPKIRSLQLLSLFLMGEPKYRGDVDADPTTAELFAVCKEIAEKEKDPLFVLKLAHYTRHTLTFRNTSNFLLAASVKLEACTPFVRKAIPKCTNLPTDLLELWDYWRKLSGTVSLPSCLKKGFALKLEEFSEYQLGKYINAKVPKPQQVVVAQSKSGGKGKGKGKGKGSAEDQKTQEKKIETDPLKRPLTLKTLMRTCHFTKNPEAICGVLRKRYPDTEEVFKDMQLDKDGKQFDPSRVGEKFRIRIPKTAETQLSEKGNIKEVWEDLVKTRNLPFMAMLKNLRNIILAGCSETTHLEIIRRLSSPKDIENCKQVPTKFLSAFQAIDFDDATLDRLKEESTLADDFIMETRTVGAGKEAKKIEHKRRVCRLPPTRKLIGQYRAALEIAVNLSAKKNMPTLPFSTPDGKALVLVDVSGSMRTPLSVGPKKLHASALEPHRRTTGRPIVEGQAIDLEDYFSQFGQRLSRRVSVSMIWVGQDMDLSVMMLDKDGTKLGSVSYSNTSSAGILHSGDITNAPNGAEEVISVDLDDIPSNTFMLAFTVNSYSGQKFDDVAEAAISLRDDGLEGDTVDGSQEICAMRLTGSHRAVVACALVREDRGWTYRCLNTPQADGRTVAALSSKIKSEFDAIQADAETSQKRLVDAALMLALCLKSNLGNDRCEVVLYSSTGKHGKGYHVMNGLSGNVLSNMKRCYAEVSRLGGGTEIPISYLQELMATREKMDYLMVLTDGLVSPAKNPCDSLSRWLRSYRANVCNCKFVCVDMLGAGSPSLGGGSSTNDVLISGYSDVILRYLAMDANEQVRDVERIELPLPAEKSCLG